MSADPYIHWLIESLRKSGKSQSALAKHLGLQASAVNKIVNGSRKLKSDELARAAEFFGTAAPEAEVVRRPISGVVSAPIVGTVEAGTFREVDDLEMEEHAEIVVPIDERFPNARVIAFDVAGDSMNALAPRPILPGDRVSCVSYEDVAHQVPLRDGMVVVVERVRSGGHMREWSIKQLEIYDDRMEFHPRSTSPRHKPIVIQRDLDADDGTSVEIIALVRRVINDIPLS